MSIRDAWYSIIDLGHQPVEVSRENELAFLPFISQNNQAKSSAAKTVKEIQKRHRMGNTVRCIIVHSSPITGQQFITESP